VHLNAYAAALIMSQSAFMRGFIDDMLHQLEELVEHASQSAFMRGFIDDTERSVEPSTDVPESQSAFMRGFIDDPPRRKRHEAPVDRLNPRSCAASSMTRRS